jgi:hypothetical protein
MNLQRRNEPVAPRNEVLLVLQQGRKTIMEKLLDSIPWGILVIACLTLGLAPYNPPHFVEKLQLLVKGRLVRPIDWFDFFMHGIPWFLLIAKALFSLKK